MATYRNGRRVVREKFRKRSASWFRKGNELAQVTEADIYVVIRQGNKYYTYKSTDRPEWPPSEQDIMNHTPPPFCRGPKDFETVNEERDEEEEEDEGGGERAQTKEPAINESTQSRKQETSKEIVDQGTRVFTIPRPPVLRRFGHT